MQDQASEEADIYKIVRMIVERNFVSHNGVPAADVHYNSRGLIC